MGSFLLLLRLRVTKTLLPTSSLCNWSIKHCTAAFSGNAPWEVHIEIPLPGVPHRRRGMFLWILPDKKRNCRDIESLRSSLNTQLKLQRRKDAEYVETRTSGTSKSRFAPLAGAQEPVRTSPLCWWPMRKYQASAFSRCSELSDSQSCAAKIKATRNQAKYIRRHAAYQTAALATATQTLCSFRLAKAQKVCRDDLSTLVRQKKRKSGLLSEHQTEHPTTHTHPPPQLQTDLMRIYFRVDGSKTSPQSPVAGWQSLHWDLREWCRLALFGGGKFHTSFC